MVCCAQVDCVDQCNLPLLTRAAFAVATTTVYCCADNASAPFPLVLVNTSANPVSLYIHQLEVDALYCAERSRAELAPSLSIELQQPLHLLLPPASHVELRQVLLRSHAKHAEQQGMATTAHSAVEFGSASGYSKQTESAELWQNEQKQQPLHTAAGHRRTKRQQGPDRKPWTLVRGSGATSTAASSGGPPVTAATAVTGAAATAATGGDSSATTTTTAAAGASAVTAQQNNSSSSSAQ
jgi:hypothetical protein